MGERLREEAYKLAMLVLQSDFYAVGEVKDTVDNILALHGEAKEQPDVWEAWVQRMPTYRYEPEGQAIWERALQQWFREMPRKEQP